MSHRALARRVLYVASLCALGFAGTAFAGGVSQPTVGSTNTVVADPAVPRPAGTPCVVQLFNNESFTDATNHPFNYAPPAGCQGSWAKVVLEADFSIAGGEQTDRSANIWVGGVNLFFGTTPQSSLTLSPSWHVERDLTDYTALFKSAQQGQSLVDLDSNFNPGVVHGSARLLFYPGKPASAAADAVYPLSSDPIGAVTALTGSSNLLSKTFTLPRNVEQAYLDVFAQGQGADELWFSCVPNELSAEVLACGGGSFRETEISIDGQPAGVAPVYPWISGGALDPKLWQPIPGVQSLNFMPYRVDLTPFAGMLSDGGSHTVSVSVAGVNGSFAATAALLVYRDANSKQVTGSVTRNTLANQPATPTIGNTLQFDAQGNLTGGITTDLTRDFVIEGVLNTSKGRVVSTVKQTVGFNNTQNFIFTGAGDQYRQTVNQTVTVDSNSQSKIGGLITADYREKISYPLSLDFNETVNDNDGSFAIASALQQGYQKHLAHRLLGIDLFSADVSNKISSSDTQNFDPAGNLIANTDRQSSQDFSYNDSLLSCYKASLTASDGALVSFANGKGCLGGVNRVSWFTHPDGSPDGGNASLLW